jgi:dephospho-CoA kinase
MSEFSQAIAIIVGQPSSGKGTLVEGLVNKYGFMSHRQSKLIQMHAAEYNLPLTCREDYRRAHLGMTALHGEDYPVDAALAKPATRIAVDGERLIYNLERFKTYGALVLALDCSPEVRFERAMLRKQQRDKQTIAEFIADEAAEYDSDEPPYPSTLGVMMRADITIDASLGASQVFAQAEDFLLSRWPHLAI